ncbi:MAG: MaoC/PaaZ C-terminal domain-containing protein [bacterium]|nr:MaoC/PaaZ C-terminal domain-containing protein [bacterium]MDE0438619.1 MaoC/PaaZ C-terminal domain-containing protein [bacterium]
MNLKDLAGHDLGTRTVDFSADDAILYALAVGASASQLDLVYERDLRVLPTYACALGLWAVEAAGRLGAYDPTRSLHVGQSLAVHEPLQPRPTPMNGRIRSVYDKLRLTIVEIDVTASRFQAAYTILLPGVGAWGGDPPAPTEKVPALAPTWTATAHVAPDAAALYRLTGDKHPVHVDPSVAAAMGLDRPILHGLATMGITARVAAGAVSAHPADLSAAKVRFSRPVYPGCRLQIDAETHQTTARAEASVDGTMTMSGTFTY